MKKENDHLSFEEFVKAVIENKKVQSKSRTEKDLWVKHKELDTVSIIELKKIFDSRHFRIDPEKKSGKFGLFVVKKKVTESSYLIEVNVLDFDWEKTLIMENNVKKIRRLTSKDLDEGFEL